MHLTSAQPAERLRKNAEPSGTTDLNVLLSGLLASMAAPVSLRCDTLPPAAGAEEEWWLLLQWLLSPLRREDAPTRYVHVQCAEAPLTREPRYQLCVRCNNIGPVAAPSFENPQ